MNSFKLKIVSGIIFFIFILTCVMLSNSSYISQIFFESKNEIDNPIINFQTNNEINFDKVNSKTVFENIEFCVNNYINEKINSAKMKYCIQIIDGLDNNFLEYTIVNNKTKEELKTENKKTKYINLAINEKEDILYTLKINNKLPASIEEENIKIKIKLIAIQEN